MYPLHMILQVPATRESVPLGRPITGGKFTPVGLFTMTMHPVGFTFMAKQASGGRKRNGNTSRHLATIGLEVRVQVFTTDCG